MVTYSIYPHHFILGELSIRTWKMDLAKPSGHIPKSSQIYQSQNSIPKWLLILSVIYPIFHAHLPMIFPEIGGWFFSEGPNGVPGAHWAVRSDIGHPIGGDWNIWIMTFPSYWEWKIIPTDIYWDIYWAIYWDIYGIFMRYLSDLSGYFLSVQKKHGDLMWFGSSLRLRVGEQTDHGCFCWYEKLQKIDGYGSIPINTIFSGKNIHKSQLFDVNYRGTRVLTHCQIIPPQIAWRGFTNVKRGRDSSHQTSQLYCIIKNKRDYIWLYMVMFEIVWQQLQQQFSSEVFHLTTHVANFEEIEEYNAAKMMMTYFFLYTTWEMGRKSGTIGGSENLLHDHPGCVELVEGNDWNQKFPYLGYVPFNQSVSISNLGHTRWLPYF